MKRCLYFLSVALVAFFAVLILKNPQLCINSAARGLILCARVIIPSLYPFTFCVLFILNSGALNVFKFLDKITKKIFGMSFYTFTIFLLSLIGGYPLGAKLITDSKTDKSTAQIMQNFCVNAGPAFIITAVGNGVFGSQKIGVLLFFTHLIPPVLLAFFFRKRLSFAKITHIKPIGFIDNFIISATGSAAALTNICGFVLLFSIICAYVNTYSNSLPILKPFAMLLEVTNGVNMTRNILLTSFLLGFGGICIWCQVFSINKKAHPRILQFALCRIFHGLSSALLTYFGIKLFKITVPAVSNGKVFTFSPFADSMAVGISLLVMGIVFMISLKNKNFAGNILEDIV